jgi:hypothetical protein
MTRCRLAIVAISLAMTACAAAPPVAEVRLVAQAFDDLNSASAPLLDDLAVAERIQGRTAAERRAQQRGADAAPAAAGANTRCPDVTRAAAGAAHVQSGFCAEDSYYYSELADPPGTAAFRRSLAAVGDYTHVLLILAEGRNLEVAQAQLQSLAANVGGALELAGATGLGPSAAALAGALKPVLDLAARHSNADELRRNVKEVSPHVVALIEQLRATAPELFTTLTEQSLARFRRDGLVNAEIAELESRRIEAYRVAVSNYVVLLDQYQSLLSGLVRAYDVEGKSVTLAGLAERSAQLSAQADAWRRTFSALRLGLY